MEFKGFQIFQKKKRVPGTVCPVPWLNLSIDVDGSTRPCCKFTHQSADSRYKFANLKNSGLKEVWNSDAMTRLRKDFLSGKKPKECNACWNEESAGIKSYRQTFLDGRTTKKVDFADIKPNSPVTLDLKLSNVCNLKCRICGPVASSLWLKEELSQSNNLGHEFRSYIEENRNYFLSKKVTDTEENKSTLLRWLGNIDHVEVTGGEPLLSPENRWLLDALVKEGRANEISLLYNTNATIFDQHTIDQWKRFKKVTVCLSIDDVGTRFEYQRSPGNWEEVQQNVKRYLEVSAQNIEPIIFCSVSNFNIYYLPEYLEWIDTLPGKPQVYFNYVHYDRHFCIQLMPAPLKKEVERKLRSEILEKTDSDSVKSQIEDLVNFMNCPPENEADQWKKFIRVTALRDKVRKESFRHVFSELFFQIERLDLNEPVSKLEAVIEKIKGNEPESF